MLQHRESSYLPVPNNIRWFSEEKKGIGLWVDFKQVFAKVWKEDLTVNVKRCVVQSNTMRWIHSDCRVINKAFLCQGVQQVWVISPSQFLMFVNDFVTNLSARVKAALFEDDRVPCCTNGRIITHNKVQWVVGKRVQRAVDMLKWWTEKWHKQ